MTSTRTTMNDFNSPQLSDIQYFYKDTTVFLTGATGFIGNLLLEKIIRICSDVKQIYVLIREKKEKTTEERFKELFDDPVFELMKKEQPKYLEKVTAIAGDCSLPNLGIGEQYEEILKNEVNIVIHSAATVRFDEHLRKAVDININALRDLLKLSQGIKNLKSFIHISTAYSNCAGRNLVDEVFYKPPITGEKLTKILKCLDDNYITSITPSLLREWPNTYAMTKAIAENEILIHGQGLPIGVVRPSMITATDHEPIPGWINNYYGPTGVVAATGLGVMRCMCADSNEIADIIPGDYVSNATLASAWDVYNKWNMHNNNERSVKDKTLKIVNFSPPIYNVVSSSTNPLKWKEFSDYNMKHYSEVPFTKAIWPVVLMLTKSKFQYLILRYILHILPALLIDSVAKLTGKTPRLMKEYAKLHKFSDVLTYFSLKSWKFHDNNTRSLINRLSKMDQSLFSFDVSKLNWDEYFQRHIKGVRIYIIKDPIENIPEGKRHKQKLKMAQYTLTSVLVALFLFTIYGLFLLFQ